MKYVKKKPPRTIIRKNEFKRESSVQFVTGRVHIFYKNYKAKNIKKKECMG